jgi:membrane protein implicated in regulation of membrane protease activity
MSRILVLISCGTLFILGMLLGFMSWAGLVLGAVIGILFGFVFFYETKDPLFREKQFPVTGTQKVSQCVQYALYAVFLGCVIERIQNVPSPPWASHVLGVVLDGSIGFIAAYTLGQLARLWHYLYQGGALDRFIWRERQTGQEGMIGRVGIVRERLDPAGKVFIRGELWDAVLEDGDPVEIGRRVSTRRIDGLTLYVRAISLAEGKGDPR